MAIEVFKIDFNGLTMMDIGSNTGGVTDCSLKHGAKNASFNYFTYTGRW